MTVRPLHDRVLIKRIEEQETVKGGIIIPDAAKESRMEARSSRLEPARLSRAVRSCRWK